MTLSARFLLAAAALLGLAGAASAAAPGAGQQPTWHAEQGRVAEVLGTGQVGAGVVVAVLDTWVDGSHPDFEGRVLPGADCAAGSCRPGPAPSDSCEHGTHVAGTVASSSYGVAPGATVLPVRVLAFDEGASPPACNGTVDGVAAGIRWAVEQGAQVVNLSLGTLVPGLSTSPAITDAVDSAARAGVVVVFAAGNAAVPVTDGYGGGALIVAATGPGGQLAAYSQRGDDVTLAAAGGEPAADGSCTPETCVTSLFPGGRYAVAAGTSMAAPQVAGAAALLLGQDPAQSREQVVDRLRRSALPLDGAGAGVLDVAAAVTGSPRGTPPPPPPPPPPPAEAAAGDRGTPELLTEAPVAPPDAVVPGAQPADPAAALGPGAGDEPEMPAGPPAVAAALLVTAAVSTVAAGRAPR